MKNTEFTQSFVAFLSEYYRSFLVQYDAQMESKMKERWVDVRKHYVAVSNGVIEPGKGLDYELTRMRSPRFTKLYVTQGEIFCSGKKQVKRILCVATDDIHVNGGEISLGEYRIYVPVEPLMERTFSGVHFIPVRDPFTNHRHPHHTAYYDKRPDTPLLMAQNTCLGSFSGPISAALEFGRLSDYLVLLYTFLTVYNSGSPLTRLENISHRRSA